MADLRLSRLGYGTASLGNFHRELTDEESWAILDAAWEVGVRYFDTAPHYGLGLSEIRLGAFLRTKPRADFVLSTKVGRLIRPNPDGRGALDLENDFHVPADRMRVWDFRSSGIRASLEESLKRLGLDSVDILYLHDPERFDLERGIDEALPTLVDLRNEGAVTQIGVGSMDTAALLAAAESGVIDLLMVAGRYTLAEQPALVDVFPACERNGVGVVNASIFNSGILASSHPGRDSRYEYGDVPAELLARVRSIAVTCAEFDVELPTAALQFAARHPLVRSVVLGGSAPAQLRDSARRMAEPVPTELWAALAERELVPA
jgi:D-threo-aldose 1-dehydrogenase